MAIVEQHARLTIAPEPPLENLTAALIRNAVHQDVSANLTEDLRLFALRDDTPDDILFELYERGICLTELAHRKGPRRLLERIAKETRYPEAIITVAIELYTCDQESAEVFQRFLAEHADCYWMLESLAHQLGSSGEKTTAFREVASGHTDSERLLKRIQVIEWERQAMVEMRIGELHRLFETREPKVWRSLARNPKSPPEILERLAEAKGIPLAREIRNEAKRTLARVLRRPKSNDG